MGLDTSHGCWHGSYTIFGEWRRVLERTVNEQMDKEDHGLPAYSGLSDPGDEYDWADPLTFLFLHSDCDGYLPTWICAPLADALERVLRFLPALDSETGERLDWVRRRAEPFIAGLRAAAAAGENVDFH